MEKYKPEPPVVRGMYTGTMGTLKTTLDMANGSRDIGLYTSALQLCVAKPDKILSEDRSANKVDYAADIVRYIRDAYGNERAKKMVADVRNRIGDSDRLEALDDLIDLEDGTINRLKLEDNKSVRMQGPHERVS